MPRVMLLIPTASYRAPDFMSAAEQMGLDVVVASTSISPWPTCTPTAGSRCPTTMWTTARPPSPATPIGFPLDAVVAVDDPGALLAARASAELKLPNNDSDAVMGTRDKSVLRARLDNAGMLSPPWRLASFDDNPTALAESLDFPVVIKPLALNGSRGVMRADTPDQFARAVARLRSILQRPSVVAECDGVGDGYLIEGYIPGIEVALEGLLRDGELHTLAVFDKPDPLDGPFFEETIYVTPSRLPQADQEMVVEASRRSAEALGLREGPLHAELRLNDQGAWPVDIAARTIGGLCARTLRFGAGMSLEEIVLRHAVGSPLDTLNREGAAAGVMMMPIVGRGRIREIRGLKRRPRR